MKNTKSKPIFWVTFLAYFIIALISGCSIGINAPVTLVVDEDEEGSAELAEVEVVPFYENNGQKWNDYIENNGDDSFSADDTACDGDSQIDGGSSDGSYVGYEACIHAGVLRKIELADEDDCSSLTLSESLDAFDWLCDDSGAVTYFYSTGLKSGKGLADLLDADGWKSNQIIISKDGEETYQTAEDASWWDNAVYDLTEVNEAVLGALSSPPVEVVDNGSSGVPDVVLLKGEGNIFTISSDHSSIGYNIQNSKISLVVMNGVSVNFSPSGNNNSNPTTGAYTGGSAPALVTFGSRNYVWIEGMFENNGTGRALVASASKFAQFKNINVRNATMNISLYDLDNSRLEDINSYDGVGTSVYVIGASDWNYWENLKVYNSTNTGIYLAGSSRYNRLINTHSSKTGNIGIHLSGVQYTIMQGVFTSNNVAAGLQLDASATFNTITKVVSMGDISGIAVKSNNNTFSHVTVLNSTTDGIPITFTASKNTLAQIISSHNGGGGVVMAFGATFNFLSNLALTNNANYGLVANMSSNDNTVTDNLVVGNNPTKQCIQNSSSGNNFSTDGGMICGGDNAPTGLSVSDHDAVSTASSFRGLVADDDANAHDSDLETNGFMPFASLTDWVNFSNEFRLWGKGDNATLTNSANRGRCSSGNCRLWDTSLAVADTVLLNQSETGSSSNGAFSSGASCPSAVDADYTITEIRGNEITTDSVGDNDGTCEANEICEYELNGQGGNNNGVCEGGENCAETAVFLVNALEILGDGIGDDDGLCESNESCTYSPNFGAYQGHGTLGTESCSFNGGSSDLEISTAEIYAYPNNGR